MLLCYAGVRGNAGTTKKCFKARVIFFKRLVAMKKISVLVALFFSNVYGYGQDTFSICAIDPVTGEVGSAGASCIDGSIIISDVHPGIGVVHTQSYWNSQNQQYALELMKKGVSAAAIIDSLLQNDAQGNAGIRQYGVVRLVDGKVQVKGFTGADCFDYKNHIEGPTYSIQGNILLGQQVLDSMKARFEREPGDLACKLMAAMQGAKMRGADTRCMESGNSSLSAFIRVAKPSDDPQKLSIDININSGPQGFEPIDSLQKRFDQVHTCQTSDIPTMGARGTDEKIRLVANADEGTVVFYGETGKHYNVDFFNAAGRVVITTVGIADGEVVHLPTIGTGVYVYRVVQEGVVVQTGTILLHK